MKYRECCAACLRGMTMKLVVEQCTERFVCHILDRTTFTLSGERYNETAGND